MKKNTTDANVQFNLDEPTQTLKVEKLQPSDELQVYYNDAYMREKQRFNDIFGLLDEDMPAPDAAKKIILENAKAEDMSQFVPLKRYKKLKSTATVFVLLTIICAGAAAYFALKFLNII